MIPLDTRADTFPVGLAGTPFEDVYKALRIVAADSWSVDPAVYRAGMAWGWYALHDPAALAGFRDVVVAALISAMAPMVKETQTDAELVEYLRQWRSYTPTFPKLQALYALFGAVVDIQPISDPESQSVLPVDDTRLAFYIRIESVDFSRPLTLAEAREIAVRATPLGSRPYPYYALETRIPCTVSPAPVGIYIRLENWETARPPAPVPVVLPTVTTSDRLWVTAQANHTDFRANEPSIARVWDFDANNWVDAEYDPSLSYASGFWSAENSRTGRYGITLSRFGYTSYLGIRNSLSYTIPRFIEANYATCGSNLAVAVPVFRPSDLIPYTAFKFSVNGVDYYYVLDDVQSDWTSDLGAIGYTLTPYIDIVLGIKWNSDQTELESVDMSNNWYWSRVITQADAERLGTLGLWYNSGYKHGSMLYWRSGMPYNLSLIDVYTDIGETPAPGALSAFSLYQAQFNVLALRCGQTYQTLVKTYKVRITWRL